MSPDFLLRDVVAALDKPTWQSLHAHSLPSLMRAVSLAWGTPQLHAYMQ